MRETRDTVRKRALIVILFWSCSLLLATPPSKPQRFPRTTVSTLKGEFQNAVNFKPEQ